MRLSWIFAVRIWAASSDKKDIRTSAECAVSYHPAHAQTHPGTCFYSVRWFCMHTAKALTKKTYLYNFEPLKPHFYVVKLEFTEVDIIFLISAQKDRLWISVRRF